MQKDLEKETRQITGYKEREKKKKKLVLDIFIICLPRRIRANNNNLKRNIYICTCVHNTTSIEEKRNEECNYIVVVNIEKEEKNTINTQTNE